jgi:hypothetical protein
MKFFMRTAPWLEDETGVADSAPPTPEQMAEMGAFVEEAFKSGKLVATGSLDPIATKIENKGGRFTLTDGPFTEAKEAVVGWAIVDVASKEEAIEYSKRFWRIVGDGVGFIQRVHDPSEQSWDEPANG